MKKIEKKYWALFALLLAILFSNEIFGLIMECWLLEATRLPAKVEVIACTSYGARPEGLTTVSRLMISEAARLSDLHPEALVVFGAFKETLDPTVEEKGKREILGNRPNILFGGRVANTVTEAETFHREIVARLGREPETVVLVDGEMHARSSKHIWERNFPKSKIILKPIHWRLEVDPNDPMIFSRNKWVWFGVNFVRHMIVKWIPFDLGYNLFSKHGDQLYEPSSWNSLQFQTPPPEIWRGAFRLHFILICDII